MLNFILNRIISLDTMKILTHKLTLYNSHLDTKVSLEMLEEKSKTLIKISQVLLIYQLNI